MDDDIPLQKSQLRELHQGREDLIEQIRQSQRIIEHSHALLKRIDELLAKTGQKKPRV